jgi:hypothetical protein
MNPEALQAVALAVAAETSVDRVLAQIVDGLVAHTAVALARVWLIGPGDICETCPLRTECPDQTRCLHLSASAGAPLEGRADWTRLDGAFRRFPIGIRKIGRIGGTGDGIFIEDVARDHDWIAHPDWVRRERISSFGGQPLVFNGEILGVLGVFSRDCVTSHVRLASYICRPRGDATAHARAPADRTPKEQLGSRVLQMPAAPDGIIGNSPALRNDGQVAPLR